MQRSVMNPLEDHYEPEWKKRSEFH